MKASSGHFAALKGKCKDLGCIPSYGSGGIMKSPAHKENVNEKLQSVANVADNVVISASFSLASALEARTGLNAQGSGFFTRPVIESLSAFLAKPSHGHDSL